MVDNRPLPGSADIFDAGLFRTAKDSARSSRAGTQGDFFVIHTPDLVLVVTLTCDRELAPVRQWRHGSRTASLEVPGRLHTTGRRNTRPQPAMQAMQANREAFLPLAKLARASAMAASITP